MPSSDVTCGNPYSMGVNMWWNLNPDACGEIARVEYQYSPLLLEIMRRQWFIETWEAENAFNRARIERLEALARMLHIEVSK